MKILWITLICSISCACGSQDKTDDAKPVKIDVSIDGIWDSVKFPTPDPDPDPSSSPQVCTDFTPLTTTASWDLLYGGYAVDECGIVTVYGLLVQIGSSVDNVLAVLPEDARPEYDIVIPITFFHPPNETSYSQLMFFSTGEIKIGWWANPPGWTVSIPYTVFKRRVEPSK